MPFVPCKFIIVLEQMEHPVPNSMARRKRIISVRPQVCILAKLDDPDIVDMCFLL